MLDLFGCNGGATVYPDDFHWAVGMFRAKGATEVIKRANERDLRTYYPFRRNKIGDLVPLWRNYLFIEFKNSVTLSICRSTSTFIKLLSIENQPVLVRKSAIDENMRLLQLGKFDDKIFNRRFYGQGSLVTIIHGDFTGKKVELLIDIPIDMPGNKKVTISLNGWRASIEVFKLSL